MRAFDPASREFLKAFFHTQDDDLPLTIPNQIMGIVDVEIAKARLRGATGQSDISTGLATLFTTPTGKLRKVYSAVKTNATVGTTVQFLVKLGAQTFEISDQKAARDRVTFFPFLPIYQGDSIVMAQGNVADTLIGWEILFREFPFSEATA